ncbi:multidrug efflux MFS transporter periplasmic adaptor subunit EmrA [Xenorhabdus nematophila]|uniref:Multidrug resistance secretion protein n=1 Tax=Xenorhabdus nematophila (strain ATCC 19061 / DSM 3370 / CCUG 14189 / LMG 1036 / NCIMB 9965 / AN6) TaxID=406817 RepID=D3V9Y7_XENNA|nr:multidrug efflux MFS transporter periplasmic adaptor subunit EmrA [Xenorhabdus nematophila]CEF31813.1 multidrug resistance secretion protein [Xenorhabdus nematophila str. Websteri]AYA39600.1 multidrug efflux MFS transporter periplasmic adaptor subunit EmrA [Xenorhabdus nematophila]MBA0018165.1 multidrug efflux MFS transporter periplasmic adaptor subunit EmrA [Xenorhabdus nematophila]MCB4424774.1 multidrug efflux MFS transporter periplasmic adaptor subunit EmrA [Xenorhabdus nematophila]QNJ37
MSIDEKTPLTSSPKLPNKKRQRRNIILLMTLLFLISGAMYTAYWFIILRHYQETDNAYVAGNQVQVMSQITGSVTTVNFDNTDFVKSGQILIQLDPRDAELALEKAENELANTVRATHQNMADSKKYQAAIEIKKIALRKAQNDLNRREFLGTKDLIGKEELQHMREMVSAAQADLDIAIAQYKSNQAVILDTPLEKQPSVEKAASSVRDAWLTLQRTKIVSPVDGYIARRSVQVGSRINSGTPLMAIIPATNMWIEANFKETQLTNMRIGQPVKITSDFYGSDVVYTGKVTGIDMGTGSAFSLLPAQNASGNWIKVVQRLPVRVELDPAQVKQHPLRIGLSTKVTVDTASTDGVTLATTERQHPAYHTNALTIDMIPANKIVTNVINSNSGNNL